ncbi:hypothetical protein MTR_8g073880 [Medicago truncatula]|uniref:Uncharacterized protein n=1 Tax=Medicago truncatula TaxID=3880 RepID=G7L9F9_MEDTR|nr:hypothetical protein MTR_8g073880 [Medicago truncatula]
MVLMQFGLRNPDSTSTNSEHVRNMDRHFKDNINLLSFHPCIFMIKTPLEGTSYAGLRPQNPKFHRLDPFLHGVNAVRIT